MNDTSLIELPRSTARSNPLGGLARTLLLKGFRSLQTGSLRLSEGGAVRQFGANDESIAASVNVLNPALYAELAFGGSVGAGESFMLGHWVTDDLVALMRLMLRNRATLDAMDQGFARISAPMRKFAHWLHRNTRAGSRRNISAHYDLGNDFFRLFLDETMMYSCALFTEPDMTLAQASLAKLDTVCQKLALSAQDHVLEVGTGWGGFALHAARRYGCRVTTTTISPSQYDFARERIRAAGLDKRVTVLLEDYRDLTGSHDKLVSIEMIEAIGHQHYEEFFRQCDQRLVRGGQALLQSITIEDRFYENARDDVDFIKRYIFPGCCIPSLGALAQAVSKASDLRIVGIENIGPHYATTLAHWRDNFLRNLDQVRALGYPESFLRMWEFYLCYCEAGFAERTLGDVQMLLVKDR